MYIWLYGRLIILLSLLLILASCGPASSKQELLVYRTSGSDSTASETLFISKTDGSVLHEFSYPAIKFATKIGTSRYVLVIPEDAQEVYLIDTAVGTQQTLDIIPRELYPDTPELSIVFPRAAGQHWSLLGSFDGMDNYLVNLEEASVTDLSGILPDFSYVSFASFSTDEAYLLLGTSQGIWLMPTNSPDQARQLSDVEPRWGAFSPDGKGVLYDTRVEASYEVRLTANDGSSTRVIAADHSELFAIFWPDGERVAVVRPGVVVLHQLSDGKERELLRYTGTTGYIYPGSSAKTALFTAGPEEDQALQAYWINIETGETRQLAELESAWLVGIPDQLRWAYFSNTEPLELAGPNGLIISSLDLETGQVRQVFSDPEAAGLNSGAEVTSAGTSATIAVTYMNSETQGWLLHADGTEPRLLATADSVLTDFALDGQSIVVSTRTTDQSQIVVVGVTNTEQRVIGAGANAEWITVQAAN